MFFSLERRYHGRQGAFVSDEKTIHSILNNVEILFRAYATHWHQYKSVLVEKTLSFFLILMYKQIVSLV